MPKEAHTKAAEHHETAAKSHRMAAEHHGKGDHTKGREESGKAKPIPRLRLSTQRRRTAKARPSNSGICLVGTMNLGGRRGRP
jgi:hypothetical protein